jgi:hypothetical protein
VLIYRDCRFAVAVLAAAFCPWRPVTVICCAFGRQSAGEPQYGCVFSMVWRNMRVKACLRIYTVVCGVHRVGRFWCI